MGNVGDSLKSPFFSKDFRGSVGNLRDVSHSRGDALGVEVGADTGGKGSVGYEIGAFRDLF